MLTALQSRVLRELRSTMERNQDGTTVSVTGESPSTGYAVGGAVPELVLRSGDDASQLEQWVSEHSGAHYGAWRNGDVYRFDVSEIYDSRDSAMLVARLRGELAIFDIANGTEITV